MNIKDVYGLTQKECDEVKNLIDRTFDKDSDKEYSVNQYLCYSQVLLQTICKMIQERSALKIEDIDYILHTIADNVVETLKD